ncbi:ROK family protein [Bacillus sp. SJS]|uniref:ROK family protein n=1 Tax=Bacillus sp. SJS TaxID=1423321 RepID=UPI0004DD7329|nr:ROK family protein [Bacillus sp. SJS]KZZ86048.1 hypothetical protein AS29_002380 [Bacillus sp. SJS]
MDCAIGLDIGGSKIAAGLVFESGKCGSVTIRPSAPSSESEMYERVRECIGEVIAKSDIQLERIAGIGAGSPGLIDREKGLALFSNNLPWRSFPLSEKLQEDFGMPVLLDNDVCMASYAEWYNLGGEKNETFVFMTVSTGIACSIIHNGAFFRGAGMAGEIGMYVEEEAGDGTFVYRTLEEVASGSAISEKVKAFSGKLMEEKMELFDYLLAGEQAKETEKMIARLAKSVYSIICLIDPHRIVLGGGVMNRNRRLAAEICRELDGYRSLRNEPISKRISVSALNDTAGLTGAGLMLLHSLKE